MAQESIMFDFLRNVRKSAQQKQQEAVSAYLDEALSPTARQHFEQQLSQNAYLQEEVRRQEQVRHLLQQLPQRQLPRNFTLDTAVYGRPAPQSFWQYYPALQAATVLTAVLFFVTVGFGLFSQGGPTDSFSFDVAAPVAMQSQAEDSGLLPAAGTFTTTAVPEMAVETAEIVVETVIETVVETVVETMTIETTEETAAESETAVEGTTEEMGDELAAESETVAGERAVEGQPPTELPLVPRDGAADETPVLGIPSIDLNSYTSTEPISQTMYVLPEVDSDTGQTGSPPKGIRPLTAVQIGLFGLLLVLTAVTVYLRRKLP